MISKEDLKVLKNKLNKLEKKDIDLIISDFDDCIFSRKEQLEDSELLRNNRGNAGNDKILEEIGLEYYGKKYYNNKNYPNIIVNKLRKGHDVIITAGYKILQDCKLKNVGLDTHNYVVVLNPEEKIIATINYVINNLKFIPSKITVYEDRPKYFIENRELLENVLGCEIEIMFVEMDGNDKEPKIKKID